MKVLIASVLSYLLMFSVEAQAEDAFAELFEQCSKSFAVRPADPESPNRLIIGDFNHDYITDVAYTVFETDSNKRGILICHRGTTSSVLLGAGRIFGKGGDSFSWLERWTVCNKGSANRGELDRVLPYTWDGDVICLEKSDAANSLIFWNGRDYEWYEFAN